MKLLKWLPVVGAGGPSLAYNEQVLLQGWYFIMSSPEPLPVEKLMMKIAIKADRIPSAGYVLIAI
jgi:hypothetical protein